MKEARWYKKIADKSVKCGLCPRFCHIKPGKYGFCMQRKNTGGTLYSINYGRPVALHVDPIEKKPLACFMPGTKTFSFGTFGCNLDCAFCQNAPLSRGSYDETKLDNYDRFSPEKIIALALRYKCRSVAFTYNEPTVFAEYCVDIANLAHEKELATVLVSNGFIAPEAAKDLYPLIDAANIDMKGFSEKFYHQHTRSSLAPVLESIKYFHSLGKHLEITNLVIPGKNDSPEMIEKYLDWVEQNLGIETILHFSAFHAAHRFMAVSATSKESLFRIRDYAAERGFENIYLGNLLGIKE